MEMTTTPYSTAYTTITLPLTDEALDLLEDRGYSELLSNIKKVRTDKNADNDVYGELILDLYPDTNEKIFYFSTTFTDKDDNGVQNQFITTIDFDSEMEDYFTKKAIARLLGEISRITEQSV